ncbi:MAG: hypothetical protein CMM46_16060 [Rhodospirillaceae bacterium]|nr:hypothetical protein [Rhodospirillaceae bacterium]|tara:strand:- start:1592 stop:1873 length:282 start_codon:yes stop_codon:yes gene_type:complete
MKAAAMILALAIALVAPAAAQFADETQSLFPEAPEIDQYEPQDDELVIWKFENEPEEVAGDPSAQSVEEICCSPDEAERAGQPICVDVDFTCL